MQLPVQQPTRHWLTAARIGLLLVAVYFYVQILGWHQQDSDGHPVLAALYFIQLGIHEVAHIVGAVLPDIWAAAIGSISEVIFTILVVVAGWQLRSRWVMVFGLLWVMLAMTSMGNYMADAVAQAMPLVGPTPDPIHDWNYVFGELGWLEAAEAIGAGVKIAGGVIGAAGLALGLMTVLSFNKKKELVSHEASS